MLEKHDNDIKHINNLFESFKHEVVLLNVEDVNKFFEKNSKDDKKRENMRLKSIILFRFLSQLNEDNNKFYNDLRDCFKFSFYKKQEDSITKKKGF